MSWPARSLVMIFIFLHSLSLIASAQLRNDSFNTLPDAYTSTFRTTSQNYWKYENILREGKHYSPFIVSGGLHATSVSLTSPAFATEAFVPERINQTSTAITYAASADDICWTIISSDNDGITGWTRVGTAAYYYQCQGTTTPIVPTLPDNSVFLMEVTITASAIASVSSMRQLFPLLLTGNRREISLKQYGAIGDGIANDARAIQRAFDYLAIAGGTLRVEQGTYLIDNTRVHYRSTFPISIICESHQSLFKWGTHPDNLPTTGPGAAGVVIGSSTYTLLERAMINISGTTLSSDIDHTNNLTGASIDGCSFDFNGARGNPYYEQRRGVNIYFAINVTVTNSHFSNGDGEMLTLNQFGPNAVAGGGQHVGNNTFENWTQSALNTSGYSLAYTSVMYNSFINGATAFEADGGYVYYAYNHHYNMSGGLLVFFATNHITHNEFIDCGTSAEAIAAGAAVTIIQVGAGGKPAPHYTKIDNNVLVNNVDTAWVNLRGITIEGTAGAGVVLYGSITNNTLIGQAIGILLHYADYAIVTGNVIWPSTDVAYAKQGINLGVVGGASVQGNNINAPGNLLVTDIYDNQAWSTTAQNLIGWNRVTAGTHYGPTGGVGFTAIPVVVNLAATPDVRVAKTLRIAHTVATNITTLVNGDIGGVVVLLFGTANNQLIQGNFKLTGSANVTPAAGSSMTFVFDGTSSSCCWYETSRMFP